MFLKHTEFLKSFPTFYSDAAAQIVKSKLKTIAHGPSPDKSYYEIRCERCAAAELHEKAVTCCNVKLNLGLPCEMRDAAFCTAPLRDWPHLSRTCGGLTRANGLSFTPLSSPVPKAAEIQLDILTQVALSPRKEKRIRLDRCGLPALLALAVCATLADVATRSARNNFSRGKALETTPWEAICQNTSRFLPAHLLNSPVSYGALLKICSWNEQVKSFPELKRYK